MEPYKVREARSNLRPRGSWIHYVDWRTGAYRAEYLPYLERKLEKEQEYRAILKAYAQEVKAKHKKFRQLERDDLETWGDWEIWDDICWPDKYTYEIPSSVSTNQYGKRGCRIYWDYSCGHRSKNFHINLAKRRLRRATKAALNSQQINKLKGFHPSTAWDVY